MDEPPQVVPYPESLEEEEQFPDVFNKFATSFGDNTSKNGVSIANTKHKNEEEMSSTQKEQEGNTGNNNHEKIDEGRETKK